MERDSGVVIIGAREPKEREIEICRSFSYKHNAGNFESRDFFMSAKSTCRMSDADMSEAEDLSERLYIFCRAEVLKTVAAYIKEAKEREAARQQRALHSKGA